MVYQWSTRFLDHGLSLWKKLRLHLKKPWSITFYSDFYFKTGLDGISPRLVKTMKLIIWI
jgi:hypothetical protein